MNRKRKIGSHIRAVMFGLAAVAAPVAIPTVAVAALVVTTPSIAKAQGVVVGDSGNFRLERGIWARSQTNLSQFNGFLSVHSHYWNDNWHKGTHIATVILFKRADGQTVDFRVIGPYGINSQPWHDSSRWTWDYLFIDPTVASQTTSMEILEVNKNNRDTLMNGLDEAAAVLTKLKSILAIFGL